MSQHPSQLRILIQIPQMRNYSFSVLFMGFIRKVQIRVNRTVRSNWSKLVFNVPALNQDYLVRQNRDEDIRDSVRRRPAETLFTLKISGPVLLSVLPFSLSFQFPTVSDAVHNFASAFLSHLQIPLFSLNLLCNIGYIL